MSHTASAPLRRRRPLAERLLRAFALAFLSFLLFYLRLLAAVVRLGIGAVKRAARAETPPATPARAPD